MVSPIGFFDSLLKMIHPFMPFITEELWHSLSPRGDRETIMLQRMPVAGSYDSGCISGFEMAKEAVVAVRAIRQQKNISPKEQLKLRIYGDFPAGVLPVVTRLANLGSVETVSGAAATGTEIPFMVRTVKMSILAEGLVDTEKERVKLEADLRYQEEFLAIVRRKLSNEKFVNGAPEKVVAAERKKEADSISKIESIKASLAALK